MEYVELEWANLGEAWGRAAGRRRWHQRRWARPGRRAERDLNPLALIRTEAVGVVKTINHN